MVRSRLSRRVVRWLATLGLLTVQGCGGSLLWRPSMTPFRQYFQRPDTAGELTVRFLGTSSLLFTARGSTAILMDGFVSRPDLIKVGVLGIRPHCGRIVSAWSRLNRPELAAVFAGHAHYDHAMDSPIWAQLTGATLVGSRSVQMLGLGIGLPENQTQVVREAVPIQIGEFDLTFVESEHGRPDRYPGTVRNPLKPRGWTKRWKTGLVYSVFIGHRGRTILVQSTAGYRPGALRGRRADVVYLAIGGLGRQRIAAIDAYWREVVRETGARRVILVHWDNFFRPLDDKGLWAAPYGGDHVSRTITRMVELAAADGVDLRIPPPWVPTNPFDTVNARIAPATPPRSHTSPPRHPIPVPDSLYCRNAGTQQ